MNILVVAPTPFFAHRGTHMRIFDQIKHTARIGNTVTIATYHIGEDPDFGDVQNKVLVKRIHRLLFWYNKKSAGPDWQKVILDVLLINKVFWLVIKNNYDVIHAHLHEGVLIASIVKKMVFWKNIKVLGDFHGDLVGEMVDHGYLNFSLVRKVFKIVESFIYSLPDRIITSSRTLADNVATRVPYKVIGCIPDGKEIVETVGSRGFQIKKDLGIPKDASLVLYTGGFTPDKGLGNLFSALEHPSIRALENVYVCLAGSPYHVIAQQVEHHVAEQKIVVLDHFKSHRLDDIFSIADVVVDPKGDIGFQSSGKMIRYVMAGVPIACFNTEVNRLYLGEEYQFARLGEFGSLAQRIVQMVSDPIASQQAIDWIKSRQKLFHSSILARALNAEYLQLCTQ